MAIESKDSLPPMTPGLREKKKQRTRAAIARAALDLFERKGFSEVTVDEIAVAAEVSPRTLFRYFQTKDEIVFGEADRHVDFVRNHIRMRPVDERPCTALLRALLVVIPTFDEDAIARKSALIERSPELTRRMWELSDDWAKVFAEDLARRDGLDRSEPRLLLIATVGQVAVLRAVRTWRKRGATPGTLQKVFTETLELLGDVAAEAAQTAGGA